MSKRKEDIPSQNIKRKRAGIRDKATRFFFFTASDVPTTKLITAEQSVT